MIDSTWTDKNQNRFLSLIVLHDHAAECATDRIAHEELFPANTKCQIILTLRRLFAEPVLPFNNFVPEHQYASLINLASHAILSDTQPHTSVPNMSRRE